jgi:SAM-dependent methyltransferase
MPNAQPLLYGGLADWFHLLSAPDEYGDEAAEVLRLLEAHVEGSLETALELGSGGGNLASHLAARLRLTLTDVAPGMLELSRRLNPGVEHIVGDMRTLRLERTFDAVVVHDAITYMTTESELGAALRTAAVHLRPGGAAVLMPDWVLDTYRPQTEHGGRDEGPRGLRYLEWDRELRPGSTTVETDYIIVTRIGDEVAVHHDVHHLGIFARSTWMALLEAAGFAPHRLDGAQGLDVFVGVRRADPP